MRSTHEGSSINYGLSSRVRTHIARPASGQKGNRMGLIRLTKSSLFLIAALGASSFVGCSQSGSSSGQAGSGPVDLGSAGNYVILAKSGISNVSTSAITGDIGLS